MAVVVTPSEGLARLRAAAGSGELRALCQRQHVTLLTVFGSAGRGEPDPRDLDIGVVTEHGADFDLFGFKVDHGKVSAAIPLALEQYGQYVRQSCDGSAVTPQAPCDLQQSMVASCM